MWNSLLLKTPRRWSLKKRNGSWKFFEEVKDLNELKVLIKENDPLEVHVGCDFDENREWVIDIDTDEENLFKRDLKNNIAIRSVINFFGKKNIYKIFFTGNKGAHIWLRFNCNIKSEQRKNCFGFIDTTNISENDICSVKRGCFIYHFLETLKDKDIENNIKKLYGELNAKVFIDLLPKIDGPLFFSNKKNIRAPFSFHEKGRCYSQEISITTF